MAEKRILYEVSIIRPLVISLLVVAHSLTIFNGGWSTPDGVADINAYAWIRSFITGFRIETIALIGGYVFAYQVTTLGRNYHFGRFALKKMHRLIIPCIFFGVFYMLFFKDLREYSVFRFMVELLSGPGHLWFLPMLFWCFLAVLLLDRVVKKRKLLVLILLFPVSLLPELVPFGIGRSAHFLFYFYGGYYLWTVKDIILAKLGKPFLLSLLTLLYFLLVPVSVFISNQQIEIFCNPLFNKAFNLLVINTSNSITTIVGILALYSIVCFFVYKKKYVPGAWVLTVNRLCYGIYVFHQFLLLWLYFHTGLPQHVNSYILPWIALFLAYSFSLLFTKLSFQTRIGRYLIG